MSVYIITKGLHTNYHIVTVFSKKEDAIKFVEDNPELYIEQYALDEFAPKISSNLSGFVQKILRKVKYIQLQKDTWTAK